MRNVSIDEDVMYVRRNRESEPISRRVNHPVLFLSLFYDAPWLSIPIPAFPGFLTARPNLQWAIINLINAYNWKKLSTKYVTNENARSREKRKFGSENGYAIHTHAIHTYAIHTHSHLSNSHSCNSHLCNSHLCNSHLCYSHLCNSHSCNSHLCNSHPFTLMQFTFMQFTLMQFTLMQFTLLHPYVGAVSEQILSQS